MRTRNLTPACAALAAVTAATPAHAVNVRVDAGVRHQTMEGFGATTISLVYNAKDNVPAALRSQAIAAAYRDVHLNMGNLEPEPFESPASNVYAPANDDGDPFNLNASGFNWIQSDNLIDKVVNPGKQYGFDDYWIGPVAGTGFSLSWVNTLRSSDYNAFLDEIAEHVLAIVTHWRDAYGITPRYFQLWNEPLSGNDELVGGSPQELVDIVKRAGDRMKTAGFSMQFVVPAEETESISLNHAQLILSDAAARPYVGAIAYHPYPYGSTYASVPNILSTSGAGQPSAQAITVRNSLRDLGAQYGIPVFMVEVSHSELAFDDFNGVRGRAIHIHDELEYADAAAYFGMNAFWDSTSHAEHYAGRMDPGFYSETDTIVLIDNGTNQVHISPMGHAIGHYARAIRRGAVRLEATSDDALVQATAFRDDTQGRFVLVSINNATGSRSVQVSLSGLSVSGTLSGEQSTAAAVWQKLANAPISQGGALSITLPAESVTTWWAPISGGAVDGGVPNTDSGAGGPTGSGGGSPGGAGASGGLSGATSSGGAGGSNMGGTKVSAAGAGGRTSIDGGAQGAGAAQGGTSNAGAAGSVATGTGGAVNAAAGDSGDCGCRMSSGSTSGNLVLLLIVAGALAIERRRHACKWPRIGSSPELGCRSSKVEISK
jgi:MYXO-CTERM domain-containing protein